MADAPSSFPFGPPQLAATANTVRSPDYKDIYSNYVKIGVSPSDFNVIFSRMALGTNNQPIIEDLTTVRMSPQQFKALADNIVKTISAWESVFGNITITTRQQPKEKIEDGIKKLKDLLDKAVI